MSDRESRFFAVVLAVTDLALIILAFVAAWYLRYELELGSEVPTVFYEGLLSYLPLQTALGAILLVLYWTRGLYRDPLGKRWIDEVGSIVGGTTVGVALLVISAYYVRPFAFSRLLFIYVWGLVILFLVVSRLLKVVVRDELFKRGIGVRRVVIAGAEPLGLTVMKSIVARPNLGYRVLGFVDGYRQDDLGRFPYLGRLEEIREIATRPDVDEVIIALPSASHQEIMRIVAQCERAKVRFRIVPDLYQTTLDRVDIHELDGIPLIGVREASLPRLSQIVKRLTDLIVSSVLIILLSPFLLLIALAIKLDSPGPILFRQIRVGRGSRQFEAYKFRSMRVGAEQELERLRELNEVQGPLFKMRDDPRLTRVGKALRRFSLDELPQLFNVVQGDMSMVGPRPPLPAEVESYADWQRKRLEVAPGLTGLWQVSGRSELPFDEMVLLDLWYIENWSIGLDIEILLRTVPAVLTGRGAY
ncbi:MAG: sugar transferase [Chloroflexi bacterium]|nr:sugar transferase [Chloroflexota bacterium]